jgi:bifunctional DNase/RNase
MPAGLTEMVVESVRVHMLSSQHVVILKEAERDRYLPIWIGPWEANAIAMKLQGVTPERPLTHDLFARTLDELGVAMQRIIVSDLAEETYRARLVLDMNGETHEVDARPSDAIALAVRAAVPIFATDAVLDRAGVVPETDEEEKLSVFREFVNSLELELGPPDRAPGAGDEGEVQDEPPEIGQREPRPD